MNWSSRLGRVLFLFVLVTAAPASAATCAAVKWISYGGTQIWKAADSEIYFYVVGRMAIDADGAPNAYHPDDTGIDALANAGFPNGGWKSVLVVDPDDGSKPYVQTTGEFAGYFVAKTTLQDKSLPVTDVRRYVDSRKVPYLVFPGAFYGIKGTGGFGDTGMALNLANNKESPLIVADAGPTNAPLREVSIRLAENLGGVNVNPRNGAGMPTGDFVYVVSPKSKSSPPWPVSSEELQQRGADILSKLGGWDGVRACLSALPQ